MRLSELLGAVEAMSITPGADGIEVEGITIDSRRVRPGDLFACVPGENTDGHDHAPAALAAGAVALVTERPLGLGRPEVVVPSTRAALGPLAATLYGHPSRRLDVIGVTGTNGKTTTTYLLQAVLAAAGRRAGIIGTLTGARTTPEAPDLQRSLAEMRRDGFDAVAMEVSSHALAQGRVGGTRFAVGIFTNLGRDHLDFHHTIDDYFEAKASLFEPGRCERAVVNVDDPYGRVLAARHAVPTTEFRLGDAENLVVAPAGSRFRWRGEEVHLPLGGRFNVTNAVGAATAAAALGIDSDAIARGLSQVPPIRGRFEMVAAGQPFAVIVDYAHTPDGLREVLAAAREIAAGGRVLVVFGAGGDRDPTKRPEMGAAAAAGADAVYVTSDNPRSEVPAAIIEAVRLGIPPGSDAVIEPDRRAAIALAIAAAQPGDVVVIAGKGHETTQTIGDRELPFDDREVARDAIAALAGGAA